MHLPHRDISMFDEKFLARTLKARMTETRCASTEEYNDLLARDSAEEDAFAASLLISHSEFFRDSLTWAVVERIVLPDLVAESHDKDRRELRVWSAGCAAGQEPYSMAMLIGELPESNGRKVDYRIFATDARDEQISKARTGFFTEEALGNVDLKRLKRWFSHIRHGYSIVPKLAGHVDFSAFDLLDNKASSPPPSIFGCFDIVLCRNLLFYYRPKYRKAIIDKLNRCLNKGAYLATGETERAYVIENGFREIVPKSAVFCRRTRP